MEYMRNGFLPDSYMLVYSRKTAQFFLEIVQGNEVFKNNWLADLVKKENGSIRYLGRDESGRLKINITAITFDKIRNNPMFVMKAEDLRALSGTYNTTILGYLCHPTCDFENDLDK